MVRFDQPCYAVKGAVEYFREHMALGDYLSQHGRAEMTWCGKGAEQLGLAGQCDLVQFEKLCRGLHPAAGEKLMVRDKGAARRVCYFGQISPPKDVSVLHLVGGDARIAGWWTEAVAETLVEMEAVAATRVRRGGKNEDRTTGNVVGAIVTHDANRALDPQLHTHVCFMNLTWDAEETRWKSLQASGLYRHQGYFREVCYNRLATRMREAGYELERVRRIGFTVKGLPEELRETFSKRRRAILRAADGIVSQDELQQVALETRARKTDATAAGLRERWVKECGEHWRTLEQLVGRANGKPAVGAGLPAGEAVLAAEEHVFERVSVADQRVVLREALVAGRGQVELAELKRALAAREQGGELIRTGDMLASREGLEAEREFTGWAATQKEMHPALGEAVPPDELSADQARAVDGLLRSRAGVMILQGDAGTGKTVSLKHVVVGVQCAGGQVFGCAPSAAATFVLRNELTPEADTLQRLLVDEQLQAKVRGRVILVDEAGLIAVREMRDLCRLAGRNDNRLVLVGDTKQHHSVEAGDALRALQVYGRVPTFRLTEIRRQRDPSYRRAVGMLARGDAFGAFAWFNRLGAVKEVGREELWATAARDYVETLRRGQSCLAISPVWSEIHAFTAEARGELKRAGMLGADESELTTVHSLKWTRAEKRQASNYQPGDVLTFFQDFGRYRKFDALQVVQREGQRLVVTSFPGGMQEVAFDPRRCWAFDVGLAKTIPIAEGERLLIRANLPEAELRNGDVVEVKARAEDGTIQLIDSRTIPAWFRELSHGYATTSHAAQGRTVDRGLLLMAEEGIAAGNLKQAYVSNSRFRESQAIYTTNKRGAREAMMRPADRKLAIEAVPARRETVTAEEATKLWLAVRPAA
jgi:conjugative relaxase-like TrwC/TraI family protein